MIKQPDNQKRYSFTDLVQLMERLRDPDGGCPWDLQQNFETIAPYTIEEAYEVHDAILRKDFTHLKEELGDLLFQPVYHAQIAAEAGYFSIEDVIHDVTSKMIARHPHVFGDENAKDESDVNAIWDRQKEQEKQSKPPSSAAQRSILDDVPKAFPALLRAHKLQKKVAKIGFEWPDIQGVLDKMDEEILELREAVTLGDENHIAEELGDLLFVLVNYARMSGFNAEDVMRAANEKFERRFRAVEAALHRDGITLDQATLPDMEEKWQDVKRAERTQKK